jgi:hypothetical protein
MKPQSNKIWFIIAVIIIGNVAIFYNMSKKLESYVADSMIENTVISGISNSYGQK